MAFPADEHTGGTPPRALDSAPAADELTCVNRALRTLSAGNRTLLRASDEQELVHEMCRVIVETGGYGMAAVAYAEHDAAKSIRWVAAVGEEPGTLAELNLTWADTVGGGTAVGEAIRTGQPIVGRRATDSLYNDAVYLHVLEFAARRGYASATAFPLRLDDEVLGALCMAATEPDAFSDEAVRLLSELSDDLAYGIATLRMRVKNAEAQAMIARLAYYDSLTGLPNRTLLVEVMEAAIEAAKQQRSTFAVLHLEVGRFHEINKVLGYRAGDEILRVLAARLTDASQANETVARMGEAEFALLLPSAGAEYAIQVAQRLVNILREPIEVKGLMLDAQVGIGISLFPGHGTDAEVLTRRAKAAMQMRRPGRGGYAVYTGGQEQENARRLALMGDLHRALKNNELHLYCQPKVDIGSRRVSGAEALIRWHHPQHGIIATSEFILLAEQAGLITPVTNWMLAAAFGQSYAWHEEGLDRALAVNLSAEDLYDSGLIDRIRGLFSTWGIAPEAIQFELTESALMADRDAALETLTRLKRLDVELFIDDYGTGYSSLSYLQRLPVDALKIDQSFVMPMIANADSAVIVRSTIELGHNLGLKVVAEGVESQPLWDQLATLGCDVAQGYFISMPMPAEQFQSWESKWLHAAS